MSASADLLATIIAATRRIVEVREQQASTTELEARAARVPSRPGRFEAAVRRSDRINIVAECKRRSPAKGVLQADYDPAGMARTYEAAGAAAISVLTEPAFFDGELAHLEAVRSAVQLPVLRKDFIISRYQLLEAKAAGAAAVLLIVAALDQAQLQTLSAAARALGLDALIEVHDVEDVDRAVAAGARVIGVNNRDLRTLAVDLRTSEALIARIPSHVIAVSESGIATVDDVQRLRSLGYRGFLMGERLMTAARPDLALRALVEPSSKLPACS